MSDDGKFIWQPPDEYDGETLMGEPVVFDPDIAGILEEAKKAMKERKSWDRYYMRPDGTDRRDK